MVGLKSMIRHELLGRTIELVVYVFIGENLDRLPVMVEVFQRCELLPYRVARQTSRRAGLWLLSALKMQF